MADALPDILDALIVGGGPFGTAVAFRLKELGRRALVVDYDDLMKRIRDYAKDKQILPDYGGGDRMQFPKGGELISRLHFQPIDKDEMCRQWKALYREFDVPSQIGVELTGLTREDGLWHVHTWNHNKKGEQHFHARHVVLAFGRGVPRRLDIPGHADGLAFGLADAAQYVGEPALVIGGGTSAAEAVIAISEAKNAAGDATDVFWSYRGEKMPKVSRALAEPFFNAFVSNGNVRYLANSEPVAVLQVGGESFLSVRTNRAAVPGMPPETTQLEFKKRYSIACIGEDIPEALLAKIGAPLVAGGDANKKRIAVTPLLETRLPNVYLAGDVLSPAYFETTEFDDPTRFKEVKRRGNIKAALRDGVVIADVIDQKLAGKTRIDVKLEFEPAAPSAPSALVSPAAAVAPGGAVTPGAAAAPGVTDAPGRARLISILASGVEANEFALEPNAQTTIGRAGASILFPEDLALSDIHARIIGDVTGYRVRDEASAEGVFLQPARNRGVELAPNAIIRAGRQWLVVGSDPGRLFITHYDAEGRHLGTHHLKAGTTIVGRQSPDLTIAPDDGSLSRRHFSLTVHDGRLSLKDLGSANGTFVKVVGDMRLADDDRLHLGGQVLQFSDEAVAAEPTKEISVDVSAHARVQAEAAVAGGAAAADGTPSSGAAGGAPAVTFSALGRMVPCTKGQTICEAAEHAGIKMDADCHQGVCGMDPVKITAGCEHLSPVGSTERSTLEDLCSLEPGPYRLACMARVSGPVVVDILEQDR
jgi:thioredoxin reductase/pSer/pThr/pTyr-binding forkhead associated (FHA) protein/ferredoxin